MHKQLKILSSLLLASVLAGCASSDDSPFTEGGGSSSNIISSTNFAITASELSPDVLEFAIGSITIPSSKTANRGDLITSTSPVQSTITVTAADNEGALVSSGTVYFSTQYGILSAPSCQIQEGRCEVTWESVADLSNLYVSPTLIDIVNNITAWTYGAEGFIDLDADGILSDNEIFFDTEEPYVDNNDNNTYDATTDSTIVDATHDGANGTYEGPNCDSSTRTDCGTSSLIPIFASVDLRLNYDSTTVTAFNVTIDTPADGVSVATTVNINFTATAIDPDDGTILGTNNPLTGNNIVWSSDLDGVLTPNNSNNINVNNLSIGTHVITVTATDSDSNTTTDTINVTITP